MTQSYRRSGDEMPQDRPYAYGDDHGQGYGQGQGYDHGQGQGQGQGHEAYGAAPGAGFSEQAVPPPPPYAPERRRRARRPVALIAAVALASGLIGGGSAALIAGATGPSAQNSSSTPLVNAGKTSGSGVSGVAKAVSPAIVEIKAQSAKGESTGSGVVVTSDGEIVTNNHVLAGADTVTVTFSDGSRKTAEVVGTDPGKDLALVKVRGAKNLTAASLGDSSKITVGDQVVAIGSPEGLTGSVTSGIVSALDRDVTVPKEEGQGQQDGPGDGGWPFEFGGNQYNGDTGASKTSYKAIQTDASLNPGNSGGALINMQGQIIGINSAMYSPSSASGSSAGSSAGSVGLGFAIPINTVKDDLDALRGGGNSGV
ncbi:trypsin-like peptidase domain-containing protein [Streptomyces sp. Je 1-4]|uniref:S1C family serine protease n=1 Tax=Streptomyces TaxID=1883 RepID=UPI0021D864F6|nr:MULTISPECIES: trypsin-like peptidase domain-containing protein [unclassified Streptomyces]UYB40648.1 trypsin-like peptidase domain-containing protein [Streptomyces sp. Je 1-4]UZQ36784.1 trypsin-like peptidase domain-containing protein [Streptomyces sp. Je 1-4] [Streptomyces sp. Je 1-4 4N24]UZQ44201.1 trypsin-like peptidase domain-containing protein [Streptomyces sp. Je 1-4] [Streptomyces sp. Je 1-4 4N24_ara]